MIFPLTELARSNASEHTGLDSISSLQLLSCVWLFVTTQIAASQASPSITNYQSLLQFKSIESVMPSNHLIFWGQLLLLPSIFPNIRVFSIESILCIRWPKDWSFSFSINPSSEYSGCFPLGLTGLISLQSKGLSRVFFNTTVQKYQCYSVQSSLQANSHIHTLLLEKSIALTRQICWQSNVSAF